MKTHVSAKVLQKTEEPLMLAVSTFPFPDTRTSEHRAAFREEVEYEEVANLQIFYHLWTWILGPSLNHPHSLRIGTLHGIHQHLSCFSVINGSIIIAFVERIHGVIGSLTEEMGE